MPTSGERIRTSRRSWRQRLLLGTGAVVVLLALLGVAGVVYFLRALGNIDRADVDVSHARAGDPINYLVVGNDRRAEGDTDTPGQRSDTIMIVRLDPGAQQASVLSFPRDLIVTDAVSGEEERINVPFSIGTPDEGRQRLINTLVQNFNVEINAYVEVGLQGFKQLVDSVGGINIWAQNAIRDRGSGLYVTERGCVTLNGEQALAFARSRELQYMTPDGWSDPDPRADLGRVERQQVFMRRAVSKMIDSAQSDPRRLLDIIRIGSGAVTLDGGTEPRELFDQFRDFDLNNLVTYSLPVLSEDGRATVDVDRANAEPILNVFRGVDPGETPPSFITVRVLNSTPKAGQAANAAAAFQTIGFRISEPTNISEPHPRTTVYHRAGEEAFALRVARHITGGADIRVREDLDMQPGEVVVITGDDFTNVHMRPTPVEDMPSTTGAPAGGAPAEPSTTSTPPESTTTTVPRPPPPPSPLPEFVVGDPPPGQDCDS